MPRVSEAHLAARREQIIEAATRCFVRNGFHQTSMQDVIREAGLSVGAFYRYFSSKAELIRAIAEEKVGSILATLDHLLEQDPPPPLAAALAELLTQVDANLAKPDGPVRIAVQVWGEAAHDPAFADLIGGIYGRIRASASALAERARSAGQLPPQADPEAVGAVMVGLVQGYIIQRVLVGRVDREVFLAGLDALIGHHPAVRPPAP
ncbi:TetR/AcrR family transcriptional regulator [Dactylosporangium salmoneum]|uniref:TetR/AcrR family transcriptional regulator n=1 Tax=Dactylosporangium salmoneum TaxID=53361 RepID=A0ABN3GU58_9ACTN